MAGHGSKLWCFRLQLRCLVRLHFRCCHLRYRGSVVRYFSFAPASAPSLPFDSFSAFSAFSASFDAFQSTIAAVAVASVAIAPAVIDTMHTIIPGPIKTAAIVRGKAVLGSAQTFSLLARS